MIVLEVVLLGSDLEVGFALGLELVLVLVLVLELAPWLGLPVLLVPTESYGMVSTAGRGRHRNEENTHFLALPRRRVEIGRLNVQGRS
jgi:hypothetical protein